MGRERVACLRAEVGDVHRLGGAVDDDVARRPKAESYPAVCQQVAADDPRRAASR